jgi:hypothetical protein
MGMMTGGQGGASQMGGSGTMIPSARAIAGKNKVEIRVTIMQRANKADLVFIFSSRKEAFMAGVVDWSCAHKTMRNPEKFRWYNHFLVGRGK